MKSLYGTARLLDFFLFVALPDLGPGAMVPGNTGLSFASKHPTPLYVSARLSFSDLRVESLRLGIDKLPTLMTRRITSFFSERPVCAENISCP